MDSHSDLALKNLYIHWKRTIAANPAMTLDDIRALFEHWGDVTAEPGGVDYVEVDAGGIEAMWALPKRAEATRTLLCLHGGGYVLSSMYSHRKLYGHFAKAAGCRALIVNYGRAPERAFPGPVDDVVAAYRWLLAQHVEPRRVAFVGDSAGGTLAVTSMLRARETGLPMPAAAVVIAPYVDPEARGASYDDNAALDCLGARDATLQFMNLVLGENGDRHGPLINPVYADLRGLPPMLIQVGGDDVLLDDSRALHSALRAATVESTLEIVPSMQHVFHMLVGAAVEATDAVSRAVQWLEPRLAR